MGLYDALAQIVPSPVVRLNRAVAMARAYGPEAALELVDELASKPALARYHLRNAVRGDLLAQLGRGADAAAFEEAGPLHPQRRRTGGDAAAGSRGVGK